MPNYVNIIPHNNTKIKGFLKKSRKIVCFSLRQLVFLWLANMSLHFLVARAEFSVIFASLPQGQAVIRARRNIKQSFIGNIVINTNTFKFSIVDNKICVVLPKAHGTDVINAAFIQSPTAAARTNKFFHIFIPFFRRVVFPTLRLNTAQNQCLRRNTIRKPLGTLRAVLVICCERPTTRACHTPNLSVFTLTPGPMVEETVQLLIY